MTMSSAVSKVTLNGDGVQTSWPFSFKVWKADDLEVSITNAEGVTTVVSNWSVELAGVGGTVTYPTSGSPLPSGSKITIARSMDFLQDVDLVSGTRWDPEVVETALDQATAERQQLKEKLDRAIVVEIADSTTPAALRDSIFAARDTAVSSAASALDSAERAEIASSTVSYYNHEGTLLTGEDTISLPWAYDTQVGVEVFLGGVKQTESSLVFTDAYTVTLDTPVAADTDFEVVASAGARGDLANILASSAGSNLVGFLQSGTGATARTVQEKLRDVVSVKDFGAVGDGVADDYAALQKAADWANETGGTVLVNSTDDFYAISKGLAIYSGRWVFDNNALIKNTANDIVDFWNNTAAFIGTYLGAENMAGVVLGEASYAISNTAIGDTAVTLSNSADAANFSVGDIVYVRGNNVYSNQFYKGVHVSEVAAVDGATGRITLLDPFELACIADGGSAVIQIATGTVVHSTPGLPAYAKLAVGVEVENGQFASVCKKWNQVVHVSSHKCRLDFAFLDGNILLGINPCSYTHIDVRDSKYAQRAFELAYYHYKVTSNIIRSRRSRGIPGSLSVPFTVNEHGSSCSFGIIDINDYDYGDGTLEAAVSFFTPNNYVRELYVNGSRGNGLELYRGGYNTVIDYARIVNHGTNGININVENAKLGHIDIGSTESPSCYAVYVRPTVDRLVINSADLFGGGVNDIIFNGSTVNAVILGNINSSIKQDELAQVGFEALTGTGADVTHYTYTVPAGKSSRVSEWKVILEGNIPASALTATKTIKIVVNGTAFSTTATAAQTGFFRQELTLRKNGSNTGAHNVSNQRSSSWGGVTMHDVALVINTNTTAITISLVSNLNASDTWNLRGFIVQPSRDKYDVA